ncbi:hypothetical protein RSAG8_04821, partial [Rhizoctonia solani AG-8 WAC10335]
MHVKGAFKFGGEGYGTRFGAYGLSGYPPYYEWNSLFSKGYINGAVGFIYGINSSIWITRGTIETAAIANGWIAGTVYLAIDRPWRNYARVSFQNSVFGSQVQPAGWSEWSTTNPMTDHIFYGEFNNTGPGA